eukprot:COSAG02_NODE_263_length_26627_cov_47.198168_3_plen_186_part_00
MWSTANGAVAACDGVTLQRGPYESLWLRVGLATPMPMVRALMDRIEEALAEATSGSRPAAVYVTLAETSVDAEHIRALRARGFSFHRSQPIPANLARGVMRPQRLIQIAKASSTKPHASTLHPCYAPARSHLSAPPQLLSRAAASAISPGKPAYAQVAAHQQRQHPTQPTAPTSQFYRREGILEQ